jgi:hypothetical protein
VYRLPTEAEWEYAGRGGAAYSKPFHFGDSLSSTQANFNGNYPYGGAKKNLDAVARERVAVQNLRDDIASGEASLAQEKKNILGLRAYAFAPGADDQVKSQLARSFDLYKVAEELLKSKRALLQAKEESLAAYGGAKKNFDAVAREREAVKGLREYIALLPWLPSRSRRRRGDSVSFSLFYHLPPSPRAASRKGAIITVMQGVTVGRIVQASGCLVTDYPNAPSRLLVCPIRCLSWGAETERSIRMQLPRFRAPLQRQ